MRSQKWLVFLCFSVVSFTAVSVEQPMHWKRLLESNIGSAVSGNVFSVSESRLYIGAANGFIYALDTVLGTTVWQSDIGGHVSGAPSINQSATQLFVATHDGLVLALNPQNGSELWRFNANGKIVGGVSYSASKNAVYFGSEDDFVYALNANTGDQIWSFNANADVSSSMAVGIDGTLYVGAGAGLIYALDTDVAAPNRIKWSKQLGAGGVNSPAIGNDGNVYVGTQDEQLYAFSSVGVELWRKKLNGSVVGSPVFRQGVVYAATDNIGTVYAIDAKHGHAIWIQQTNGVITSSPSIDNYNHVYVGSNNGILYEINNAGTISREFNTGTYTGNDPLMAIESSPYVTGGKVYFCTNGGYVFSIAASYTDSDTPVISWSSFMQSKKRAAAFNDADGDGMSDEWEELVGLDKNNPADASQNPDGDTLSNLDEYKNETKYLLSDTDGDGYADGVDAYPLNSSEWSDANGDGIGDNGTVSGYTAVIDRVITQINKIISIPDVALLANDENPSGANVAINAVEKYSDSQAGSTLTKVASAVSYNSSTVGGDRFRYVTNISGGANKGYVQVENGAAGQKVMGSSHDELVFTPGNGSVTDPAGGDDIIYDAVGNDVVEFGKNEGNDIFVLNDSSGIDTIRIKSGVSSNDISFEYVNDDLVMFMAGSAGTLSFFNAFNGSVETLPDSIDYAGQNASNLFAVNDNLIVPAPDCSGGGSSCSDEDRNWYEFYPGDILANDFSTSSSAWVDVNSISASNVVSGPFYNSLCWFSDCFVFKVDNFTLPVEFNYKILSSQPNSNQATSRFRFVTGTNFVGTERNETITGRSDSALPDQIWPGGGNDFIISNTGNDVIHYSSGDGRDEMQILDFDKIADKIVLDAPLNICTANPCPANSIRLVRDGLDLLVKINGESDEMRVMWPFAQQALIDTSDNQSYVPFDGVEANGVTVTAADMMTNPSSPLTLDATYVGTTVADGAFGAEVGGTTGDDKIFGFGGNDYLTGANANDQIYGGDGDDTINGGNNDDVIYGDAGNDWLIGHLGNDVMDGGAGRDTYQVSSSQQTEIINNLDLTTPANCTVPTGCITQQDAVWFSTGLDETEVVFQRSGDDLLFYVDDDEQAGHTATVVTVPGYFGGYAGLVDLDFRFNDNIGAGNNSVIWDGSCVDYDQNTLTDDLTQLEDRDNNGNPDVIGGAANVARINYVLATNTPGCMKNRMMINMSTQGNDVIEGLPGDDWIGGRDGDDTIRGDWGNDVILGGAGNDILSGEDGDDMLIGGGGSDVLDGGEWGADTLRGGDTGDTYHVSINAGYQRIQDGDTTVNAGETDTLSYPEGVTANMLWLYQDDTDGDESSDDLVLKIIGTDQRVYIENWATTQNGIENVVVQGGNCTGLNGSMVPGLLSVMPPKNSEPTVIFSDAFLAPYWDGAQCN